MAELADLVEGLGFAEVRTVLASGNVLFETADESDSAAARLETALRDRFGYEAWVHVLPLDAIRRIVYAYPFERGRDGWHDYAIVAVRSEVREELLAVELDPEAERAAPGEGVIYWTVLQGSTIDSRLGKVQAAARMKPWITTRNLNTLEKLVR
tara:strand:+ start:14206 stop:14667 length:462 start_codon:yes stop_codon:yes gene_type:complete